MPRENIERLNGIALRFCEKDTAQPQILTLKSLNRPAIEQASIQIVFRWKLRNYLQVQSAEVIKYLSEISEFPVGQYG
jgi:hypothetical protein